MDQQVCGNCFGEIPAGQNFCPRCGWSAEADAEKYPHALPAGSILNGRYILGRTLGQGGFGITYIARDDQTGQRVAIKEFFPETMATRSGGHSVTPFSGQRQENFAYGMQCFLSEAQTLAQFIGEENIIGIHSYFEENGTAYFVMDYVDGISLQTHLQNQGGRISWEEAQKLLFPVMDALSVVHSKGIIHRDISPDNIYITQEGKVKLLDFGAARYSLGDRSRSLDVVLKPGYAPREQYTRRGRQGPYTDVYSLAATLYFALTGRIPSESIDRIDEDDLIFPSSLGARLPQAAEEALEKALAVQPGDRFASMAEFKAALETREEVPLPLLKEAEAKPTPQPEAKEDPKPTRWKPIVIGIALLAMLGVGLLLGKKQQPELAKPEATASQTLPEKTQLETEPQPEAAVREPVQGKVIASGYWHTVAIKEDGSVVAVGYNGSGQCDVSDWTDIVEVAAGVNHTVGLRSDGSVVAAGDSYAVEGVADWTDIAAVAAGEDFTVGLRSDGSVVAAGGGVYVLDDISGWTDIAAITAGIWHIVGLRSDGSVVSAGIGGDVSDWSDIVAVDGGFEATVGLRSDGTVVYTSYRDVSDWTDIVAVAAGNNHIIGLRSDGSVVTVGDNRQGQCDVSGWTDIVAIAAGDYQTIGLRSDGSVVATGDNVLGQCDVSGWENIRVPVQN